MYAVRAVAIILVLYHISPLVYISDYAVSTSIIIHTFLPFYNWVTNLRFLTMNTIYCLFKYGLCDFVNPNYLVNWHYMYYLRDRIWTPSTNPVLSLT